MNKYNFDDETQLYYEWICDMFEDVLRLLWERGEHDQREKDLDIQWKAIQPVLKDAFEKAKKWDNLVGDKTFVEKLADKECEYLMRIAELESKLRVVTKQRGEEK